MSDINRIVLTGRLTRPPEKVVLESGKGLLRFGLASNRVFADREETLFIECAVFGPAADGLFTILKKGTRIGIDGRLTQRRWTDADGIEHMAYQVVADRIALLDGKGAGTVPPVESTPPMPETATAPAGPTVVEEELVPF